VQPISYDLSSETKFFTQNHVPHSEAGTQPTDIFGGSKMM